MQDDGLQLARQVYAKQTGRLQAMHVSFRQARSAMQPTRRKPRSSSCWTHPSSASARLSKMPRSCNGMFGEGQLPRWALACVQHCMESKHSECCACLPMQQAERTCRGPVTFKPAFGPNHFQNSSRHCFAAYFRELTMSCRGLSPGPRTEMLFQRHRTKHRAPTHPNWQLLRKHAKCAR